MKFLPLIFTLISFITFSQYCPFIGPDITLPCGVSQTTLTADLSQCGQGALPQGTSNYGVTNIPYVAQVNNGTLVQLSDDSQSNTFNIGFTFCFYGQTFTQFRIGSNAKVTCNANFTNIVISETQKIEMIFGIYFWAIGFIATLFVYNKIGYSGCVSLFNAIFFPLLAIAIFFIDT